MKRILITERQYKKIINVLREQFVRFNNPEDQKDLSHESLDTLSFLTTKFKEFDIKKDVYVDKIEKGIVYLDKSKYTNDEIVKIEDAIESYVAFNINPRDKVLKNDLGFDSGIDSDVAVVDKDNSDVAVVDKDDSDVAVIDDDPDVAVIDDSEEQIFKTLEACNFGKNSKGNKRKVILPPSMDIKFYQDILTSLGTKVTCEKMLFFFAWRSGEHSESSYNPFATTYRDEKNEGCFYNCLPEYKSGLSIRDCITPTGCRSCKSKCVGGVRNYKTYSSGLNATVKTLTNGRYKNVVRKLKNDKSTAFEIASEVGELSTWGTGALVIEVIKWNGTIKPKPITKYVGGTIEDDNCTLTADERKLYNQHIKTTVDGNAFRKWVNADNYRLNYINRKLSDCDLNTGLDETGSLNNYVEIAFKHKGKEWVKLGKPEHDGTFDKRVDSDEDEVFVGSGKYIVGKKINIDKNGPANHKSRALGNWQSDNATDIPEKPGSVVYSITKGTVSKIAGDEDDHTGKVYGAQVTISGEYGYPDIFYTHLQNLKVSKGQKVNLGTPIGEISRWDSGSYHHVHVGLPYGEKLSSFIDMNTGEIKSGTSKKEKSAPEKEIKDINKNIPLKPNLGSKKANASLGAKTSLPTANRWGRPHHGYDVVGPYGYGKNLIMCNKPGTVDYAGVCGTYGNFVSINHGGGIYSAYGHLDKVYVTEGQKINVGDPIGLMGNTGRSKGAHLHFEERVTRPSGLKNRCGGGSPYNEVYGYKTVRPSSVMDNYYYWQEKL